MKRMSLDLPPPRQPGVIVWGRRAALAVAAYAVVVSAVLIAVTRPEPFPVLRASAPALRPRFEGIEIIGDARFVRRVRAALQLIRDRSPNEFALVKHRVPRIRHASRTGAAFLHRPPAVHLAWRTADVSLTWCAGALAHEAYHFELFARGRQDGKTRARGQEAELRCIAFQRTVLHRVGASSSELRHLARQDGRHFDLDGDGVETWNDYLLRDW